MHVVSHKNVKNWFAMQALLSNSVKMEVKIAIFPPNSVDKIENIREASIQVKVSIQVK